MKKPRRQGPTIRQGFGSRHNPEVALTTTPYPTNVTPLGDLLVLNAVADVRLAPEASTGELCGQCEDPAAALPVEVVIDVEAIESRIDTCIPCGAGIAAYYRALWPHHNLTVHIAPESGIA